MAQPHLPTALRKAILVIVWMVIYGSGASFPQAPPSKQKPDAESLRVEIDKLKAEVAAIKKASSSRETLEEKKLQEEIDKLKAENTVLENAAAGMGRLLPWLQAGLGSLAGGLLVLLAGQSLSRVQKNKLKQDLEFAGRDHTLQERKLRQEIDTAKEDHQLQSKKLLEEIR